MFLMKTPATMRFMRNSEDRSLINFLMATMAQFSLLVKHHQGKLIRWLGINTQKV